jgi:AAA domain, putative AbiEii toxin, Type IV TA system/AAA domain
LGAPEDASPDRGGSLALLELRGIGHTQSVCLKPADRINLITGDNGLGKTFLLECAWWALSGDWAERPAYPRPEARKNEPSIAYQIAGADGKPELQTTHYNWRNQTWPAREELQTIPGLVIYARVDGAFAVWDPAVSHSPGTRHADTRAFMFTRQDVWEGLTERTGFGALHRCNGLIYDWIIWQSDPKTYPFNILKNVLRRLSPPDLGVLEPGSPTRIFGGESRLMPTIKHVYGQVPLVYASAAVKRVIALAYLIVWTWNEHKAQSALIRENPQKRLVILIDELEAHLHPQWQRSILPALLAIQEDLDAELSIQLIITTHSPLVLASVEPYFDSTQDRLFLLEQDKQRNVNLAELPWNKQGDVIGWLTSNSFGLQQARSKEAEIAIEAAEALMRKDALSKYPVKLRTMEGIHKALLEALPDHDPFWPRWLVKMDLIPNLPSR